MNNIETNLEKLTPIPSGINMAEVMYNAGFAAAQKQKRKWQSSSLILLVALIGITVYFNINTGTAIDHPAVNNVYIAGNGYSPDANFTNIDFKQSSTSPDHGSLNSRYNYYRITRDVLEKGLHALPDPQPGNSSVEQETYRQLRMDI